MAMRRRNYDGIDKEEDFRSLQAWRRPTLPCLETEYHRR